ncbi:MAG: hypothetical protein KAR33_04960 [Candidatus Thorarchaeota archaeon]|nr:hypothetical protein [Candidatus Thorarchaeota archaeon]
MNRQRLTLVKDILIIIVLIWAIIFFFLLFLDGFGIIDFILVRGEHLC